MYLECCCCDISLPEWEALMKGAKRFSYRKLVKMIKETLPEIYEGLCLNFYNPYLYSTKQTQTHYILVHSAIEYFFRKD